MQNEMKNMFQYFEKVVLICGSITSGKQTHPFLWESQFVISPEQHICWGSIFNNLEGTDGSVTVSESLWKYLNTE